MALKGVIKNILYAGKGDIPDFRSGTKVTFHFECSIIDSNDIAEQVLDDSKKTGRPMELIIGKQFKMPVWEECLKSMKIGEVSQFRINKELVTAYPLVSKSYRQFAGLTKTEESKHCCGMMALKEGFGQPDLDQLLRDPHDLQFTIELLTVEDDYEKESWVLTPEEKLNSIPLLKETGNRLYNEKNYNEAAKKYAEALTRLEQLMLREKPGEDEWLALEKQKLPILLNYSQCKLLEKDYYPVIEYTTAILERDPNNVKALYRRAEAYVGTWNLHLARDDYEKILSLDSSLQNIIQKKIANIVTLQKQKDAEDKEKYHGKVFK